MISALPFLPYQKSIKLHTGRLEVTVRRSDWNLDDLCGFAGRHNPSRGYLFVSKVLGKHYPARPSSMARIQALLAEKLLALNLAEPVVMIAMAETATGLGLGIFEEAMARENRPDWLFTQTTRYALNHPVALRLTEDHCHARDHLVYEPASPEGRELLRSARTLIIVDDEMSTGNTMLNLVRAYLQIAPGLNRLVLATITCWLDSPAQAALAAKFTGQSDFVSVLDGSFTFEPDPAALIDRPVFKSIGDWQNKDHLLSGKFGRLGIRSLNLGDARTALRQQLGNLKLKRSRPVLVLGSGEFTHYPYQLARLLEEDGYEVFFQSTTRTPIAIGGDIGTMLQFPDNYHDGIDNFLYNVNPESDSQKFIGYETAVLPQGHDLPQKLRASSIFFYTAQEGLIIKGFPF